MNKYDYMQLAISLAKKGWYTTSPNPRVGCVLVKNDEIIGQGFHEKAGQGHAEVNAIADARKKGFDVSGATAYVTLEPCSHFGRTPPCAKGLIDAGIAHVVIGMEDPNPQVCGRGIKMLNDAAITTEVGVLEQEAQLLNPGFINLMTKQRPYVRCKLAASLDGQTAMASGESQWITSASAREDVQRLRAQSCAVISGADSVIFDNARMTVRHSQLGYLAEDYPESKLRQPVRIIIDSQNRVTPDLALFTSEYPVILVRNTLENEDKWPHFVSQLQLGLNPQTGKIDLSQLLCTLGNIGLNDILLESGANLCGAFIAEGLVDELVLYQAPKLMGRQGKGLVHLPSLTELENAIELTLLDIRQVGKDIKITAKINQS
jgi:diaminohydroxyphosphoribosylaminopyrimidine deaminase/5-amino-6-(5-phosphoribosylamino)uracil reductase